MQLTPEPSHDNGEEELYEKILQARAKAAKEQQMMEAAAAASAASTPSTAAVADHRPPEPYEPEEDNYKTLPCSNKMKQSSEGIVLHVLSPEN